MVKKKKKTKLFLLVFILILIVGIFVLFSFKTFNKYKNWNIHKDYFKQDKSKQKVEDWMTLRFVGSEFDIDLKEEFNVSSFSFSEKRMSMDEYCNENGLNCKVLIKDLNSLIGKDLDSKIEKEVKN